MAELIFNNDLTEAHLVFDDGSESKIFSTQEEAITILSNCFNEEKLSSDEFLDLVSKTEVLKSNLVNEIAMDVEVDFEATLSDTIKFMQGVFDSGIDSNQIESILKKILSLKKINFQICDDVPVSESNHAHFLIDTEKIPIFFLDKDSTLKFLEKIKENLLIYSKKEEERILKQIEDVCLQIRKNLMKNALL